jgi:hypothetical protein
MTVPDLLTPERFVATLCPNDPGAFRRWQTYEEVGPFCGVVLVKGTRDGWGNVTPHVDNMQQPDTGVDDVRRIPELVVKELRAGRWEAWTYHPGDPAAEPVKLPDWRVAGLTADHMFRRPTAVGAASAAIGEDKLARYLRTKLDAGQRPPDNIPWDTFHARVLDDLGKRKLDGEPERGYGLRTIQDRVRNLLR